jgi:hypothetical protein
MELEYTEVRTPAEAMAGWQGVRDELTDVVPETMLLVKWMTDGVTRELPAQMTEGTGLVLAMLAARLSALASQGAAPEQLVAMVGITGVEIARRAGGDDGPNPQPEGR